MVEGLRLVAGFRVLHLPREPLGRQVRYPECYDAALAKDPANAVHLRELRRVRHDDVALRRNCAARVALRPRHTEGRTGLLELRLLCDTQEAFPVPRTSSCLHGRSAAQSPRPPRRCTLRIRYNAEQTQA